MLSFRLWLHKVLTGSMEGIESVILVARDMVSQHSARILLLLLYYCPKSWQLVAHRAMSFSANRLERQGPI